LNGGDRDAIRQAQERADGRFYPIRDVYATLTEPSNKDMPITGAKCLNRKGVIAREMLVSHGDEIEYLASDPLRRSLERVAAQMNRGWDGPGWSPGDVMLIRYYIETSDIFNIDRVMAMRAQAQGWIKEAKRRWSAGFVPNPFGEPVTMEGDKA
jgi:hypothetical protein